MGLWAGLVLVPSELDPEVPSSWARCNGTVTGWSAVAKGSADPGHHLGVIGVADGDPRRHFLTAALDHGGPEWDQFVREHELESWGRAGFVVVDSIGEVPPGGLDAWARWAIMLGSTPPISLFRLHAPLIHAELPRLGPWRPVPANDVDSAIRWARQHVANDHAPAGPDREPLETELAEQLLGIDMPAPSALQRAVRPALQARLFTYADLTNRLESLAEWIGQVRQRLLAPVAATFGDRFATPGADEAGPPYGATMLLSLTSARGKHTLLPGDLKGWQRAITRLLTGDLRCFGVRFIPLNGLGDERHYRAGIALDVTLRDAATPADEPLPDSHPAEISLIAAPELLTAIAADRLQLIVDLVRTAAMRFEANTGFVHGSGSTTSPYERWSGTRWDGRRLDRTTRGLHWGTLLGPRHLSAIGGLDRLRELIVAGLITRLERWSPRQWWIELTDDPLASVNLHARELAGQLTEIMPTP